MATVSHGQICDTYFSSHTGPPAPIDLFGGSAFADLPLCKLTQRFDHLRNDFILKSYVGHPTHTHTHTLGLAVLPGLRLTVLPDLLCYLTLCVSSLLVLIFSWHFYAPGEMRTDKTSRRFYFVTLVKFISFS